MKSIPSKIKKSGILPPREEWDFSKVENKEEEACVWYEYARESVWLGKLFEDFRKEQPLAHPRKLIDSKRLAFEFHKFSEFLGDFKEFPKVPWLNISKPKREKAAREKLDLNKWDIEIPISTGDPENLKVNGELEERSVRIVEEKCFETVVLEIERDQHIDTLVKAFRQWLIDNPVEGAKINEKRGGADYFDKLRALGAKRLMDNLTIPQARDYLIQAYPDHYTSTTSEKSIFRIRNSALDFLKTYFSPIQ